MGNQQNPDVNNLENQIENKLFSQNKGLRVLHVYKDSVAEKANILPFLDFIIGIQTSQNENLDFESSEQFAQAVKANKNNSITLQIYNIYTQSTRFLQISLNDQALGVLLRTESYQNSLQKILKVRSVRPDSPAQKAGLKSDEDYVLGTYSCEINDVYQLGMTFQNKHIDKVGLQLCVYNEIQKNIRYVTLIPLPNWIGVQLIGAEFGSGALNEMPTLQNQQLTQEQIYEQITQVKYDGSNFKAPKVFDDNQNEKVENIEDQNVSQDNLINEEKGQMKSTPSNDQNNIMMMQNMNMMGSMQQQQQQQHQQQQQTPQKQQQQQQQQSFFNNDIMKPSQQNQQSNMHQNENASLLSNQTSNQNQQQQKQQNSNSKSNKSSDSQEKQQQSQYTFFSEKINGQYIIKREDLFPQLEIESQF